MPNSSPGPVLLSIFVDGQESHPMRLYHSADIRGLEQAGSRETLETFRAFAPAGVEVIETGCQGR